MNSIFQDIMELLEKRVKSRFSHRQIHLYPIAAPLGTPSCSTNPDNDESTALAAFNVFRLACKNMLTVKSDYVLSTLRKSITAKERLELNSSIASWNQHVSDLMEDEIVVDSLRQAWSVSVSLRRLNNLLVPIVSKLGPTKTRIEPVEFIDSICLLQQDAKISLLQGFLTLLIVAKVLYTFPFFNPVLTFFFRSLFWRAIRFGTISARYSCQATRNSRRATCELRASLR
ncbi:unnamed protein product [Dicrocoelium dendriticum]|nr:unnamed protein product [Dicrocoelium dendriticum]